MQGRWARASDIAETPIATSIKCRVQLRAIGYDLACLPGSFESGPCFRGSLEMTEPRFER
jgi:hypothetical protein